MRAGPARGHQVRLAAHAAAERDAAALRARLLPREIPAAHTLLSRSTTHPCRGPKHILSSQAPWRAPARTARLLPAAALPPAGSLRLMAVSPFDQIDAQMAAMDRQFDALQRQMDRDMDAAFHDMDRWARAWRGRGRWIWWLLNRSRLLQ